MGAGKARELLGLLDDTGLSLRKRDVPFALVLDELDGDLAPSWLLLSLVVGLLELALLGVFGFSLACFSFNNF